MNTDLITKIQPFAIALALGLLIGIERERSHPPGQQPFGLRTFVLFSLLGALAGRLNEPMIALSFTLFVGAVVIAGYFRSGSHSGRKVLKGEDIGITTEVAAVVVYGLGYLANSEPFIALLLGITVLVVLLARTRLHKFSRSQLRPKELQATAILLVLAIGILPFLPNQPIDPWRLFNPQRFGILVLIIAILQFSAYVGIRMFGASRGILFAGFLAGFVSSTAATATLSQQAKKQRAPALTIASAVILSTVAMFLELMVILFVASPKLLYTTSLPILFAAFISSILGFGIGRYQPVTDHYPTPKNPLSFLAALRLASFLGAMLIIVTLAQQLLGTKGSQLIIFLGGLVEIHGVALALATLHHEGQMTAVNAMNNLGLAIIASFISKYVIVWSVARGRFAVYATLLLSLMLGLFSAVWGMLVLVH